MKYLSVKPEIFCADILLPNGKAFAHYGDNNHESEPQNPSPDIPIRFSNGEIILTHPIAFEGKRLGDLVIRADFMGTRMHLLRLYGGLLAAVLAGSLLLVLLLADRVQKGISKPILDLTAVARQVSEKKDYSVRALRSGDDELGN